MNFQVISVYGHEAAAHWHALARLRVNVFREWPYLYEGDLAHEENYLRVYAESDTAVIVLALEGERVIGASTALRLDQAPAAVITPLSAAGYDPHATLYCGESVLLPDRRGHGIGVRFFEEREKHARALGLRHSTFCRVLRPENHPLRPPATVSLEGFWRRRGYRPRPDILTEFSWRDIGEGSESAKPMEFWVKRLAAEPPG